MKPKPFLCATDPYFEAIFHKLEALPYPIEFFKPCAADSRPKEAPPEKYTAVILDSDCAKQTRDDYTTLLAKLSASSRPDVRRWAESLLIKTTSSPLPLGRIQSEDLARIFPWRETPPAFSFTIERAILLSRHTSPTDFCDDLAQFLSNFNNEEISLTIIQHIHRQLLASEKKKLPTHLQKLLSQIAETHSLNARRAIAQNKDLCWQVFNSLLTPGLPLHSTDAIENVNWSLYQKTATAEQLQKTKTTLARYAQRSSKIHNIVRRWFNIGNSLETLDYAKTHMRSRQRFSSFH